MLAAQTSFLPRGYQGAKDTTVFRELAFLPPLCPSAPAISRLGGDHNPPPFLPRRELTLLPAAQVTCLLDDPEELRNNDRTSLLPDGKRQSIVVREESMDVAPPTPAGAFACAAAAPQGVASGPPP